MQGAKIEDKAALLKKMRVAAIAVILAMAATACATLNQAECESVNWRDLGEKDGKEGEAISYVDRHQKSCSRYGRAVDQAAWRAGWDVGIRQFCTPENGLRVGRDGDYYTDSCPAELAADFRKTYEIGWNVYSARVDLKSIEIDMRRLRRSISEEQDEKELLRLQSMLMLKLHDLEQAQSNLSSAQRAAELVEF